MQVCIIAGSITLCLSLFLLGNAVAEDGMNGNGTQSDSLTEVMCAEKSDVAMNEDYVVLVRGEESSEDMSSEKKSEKKSAKRKKDGDPANCVTMPGAGATASNGGTCTGGTACMFSGRQLCTYGTCKTINDGNGNCTCHCQ
jgi:hypothetical protein